jgi:hypothetical protein
VEGVIESILMYELPRLKRYDKMTSIISSNINAIDHMLVHTDVNLPGHPYQFDERIHVDIDKRLDVPDWVSMFVYGLPYVHVEDIVINSFGIDLACAVPLDIYEFSPVSVMATLSFGPEQPDLRDIIIFSTLSDDIMSIIAESVGKVSVDAYKNLEALRGVADVVRDYLELDNSIDVDRSALDETLTEYDLRNIRAISGFVGRILDPSADAPYKIRYENIYFRFSHEKHSFKPPPETFVLAATKNKKIDRDVDTPDWLRRLTRVDIVSLNAVRLAPTYISLDVFSKPDKIRGTDTDDEETKTVNTVFYIVNGRVRLDNVLLTHVLLDDDIRNWIDNTLYDLVVLSERAKQKIKELVALVNMLG